MKLTFFGGATAVVEHRGKRILFDPWLDDGIFHGAWYHYPPLRVGVKDIGHVDYIYISHIHEDHCSAGTIKYLNKDAEIILMDRTPNFVLKFLENHGFNFKAIHLIPPRSPRELEHSLQVDILEPDPSYHQLNYTVDSALIIKWDDFVIYNANDCTPYEGGWQYIKERYGKVDLALLPYTGGSGYPACYLNLSHEEKLKEKQRIALQGLKGFVDAVKFLQPKYAMPFADQYVIAGSRSHLNQYLPHPPEGSIVLEALKLHGLNHKVLLLNSGQSFDFDTGEMTPNEPYQSHSEDDRQRYIDIHLKSQPYDHERIVLSYSVPIGRLLELARARLWKAQEREQFFPQFYYYIDVLDHRLKFMIDMTSPELREIAYESGPIQPYLRMELSSTLLTFLLINHVSWNIADAALFIDYERQPNLYNPLIHAMLNYLRI